MAEYELNATAASILGFLDKQSMSGSELAAQIEDVIGDFWNVTRSQVYRELKLLADAGFVSTLRAGKREKQPYKLTAAGRKAFRAWIKEEPGPPIMRVPLVLQTFFGDSVDAAHTSRARAKLRAYHAERLLAYRGFESRVDKTTSSYQALRLGIQFQELMLRWIDGLPPPKPDA